MQEDPNTPVDFITRFATSEPFERVFREGMSLVEETADYLDGPGRAESRKLDRPGAVAYATESMRLTTRLMQLASWLLLQRAMQSGEITHADAEAEKRRISLADVAPTQPVSGAEAVPQGLKDLIERSNRFYDRIILLDRSLNGEPQAEPQANHVQGQLAALKSAFSAR